MKLKDFKLKITEEGVELERGTEIPQERSEIDYEKYDKLRSLGWSDDEIVKMLEHSKEKGMMSDSGYICI